MLYYVYWLSTIDPAEIGRPQSATLVSKTKPFVSPYAQPGENTVYNNNTPVYTMENEIFTQCFLSKEIYHWMVRQEHQLQLASPESQEVANTLINKVYYY